jgi:mannose-6-phosphate isomerase-like protein (cupin superfamily)
MSDTFGIGERYVHLDGERATTIVNDERFWRELMSGAPERPEIRRLMEGGWLVGIYAVEDDWQTWEMHPEGDEVLILLEGACDMILDEGGRQRTVSLEAGRAFVMPRGAWHRQVVRAPGRMLGITCGRGTQHRPL